MTNITTNDVRHLAQLSSLQLTDAESEGLRENITNVLDYITQLSDLDTAGVEPTYQVTGLQNIWRDDTIKRHEADRTTLLELAPEVQDNQVKIPKVL